MEELAAIKAVANKAWDSQQNQKKKEIPRKEELAKPRISNRRKALEDPVMDVEVQAISSESAPTHIRSL